MEIPLSISILLCSKWETACKNPIKHKVEIISHLACSCITPGIQNIGIFSAKSKYTNTQSIPLLTEQNL